MNFSTLFILAATGFADLFVYGINHSDEPAAAPAFAAIHFESCYVVYIIDAQYSCHFVLVPLTVNGYSLRCTDKGFKITYCFTVCACENTVA